MFFLLCFLFSDIGFLQVNAQKSNIADAEITNERLLDRMHRSTNGFLFFNNRVNRITISIQDLKDLLAKAQSGDNKVMFIVAEQKETTADGDAKRGDITILMTFINTNRILAEGNKLLTIARAFDLSRIDGRVICPPPTAGTCLEAVAAGK